jgi:hypothetical protein
MPERRSFTLPTEDALLFRTALRRYDPEMFEDLIESLALLRRRAGTVTIEIIYEEGE